ncbi:hypothetical protein HK098_007691 [Nowakowskiella sp. JEL0407]|nr:hypothetical protein HK098_007691 [Nowakowskiella sp. JEL0407]
MNRCDVERLLLPYFLMPLKRILDGDIVVFVECSEPLAVFDAYICGSNDFFTVNELVEHLKHDSIYSVSDVTPSTLTRQSVFKRTPREKPKLIIQAFRLQVTKIDENGDVDGNDWTFNVRYVSVDTFLNQLFEFASESRNKIPKEVFDDIRESLASSKDAEQSIEIIKSKFPAAVGKLLDASYTNDAKTHFLLMFTRRLDT